MDAVSELLAEVRARGAVFRQAVVRPPWSLRMATGAPLMLATMVRGEAWIVPDRGEAVRIGEGDVAVVRGDVPHVVADSPGRRAELVVTDADYCPGEEGVEPRGGPARTCGAPDEGSAVLISGAFERRGELSERLLLALPDVLVAPGEGRSAAMLAEEVAADRPGQQQVLDRMLDLMLVSALRTWFDTPDAHAPAWCRALDDAVVGAALRLLHDSPAHPWTVAELAARAGVSRAGLARRFTAMVGEPPMAYLTGWRIALAADLLRGTDHTVGTIARKVGYANAFALSAAFKRLRGERPSEHRNPEPGPRLPSRVSSRQAG
ncbi:AraC family transcriptional regulator [Actinosynnema pretiosum subsp. pretiosum]|uniref:Transcriptional regulator, AraC family n=2 Tax=Actinosynnema TaxID=40566 RepID=C6WK88_ACTMD|nr:AraC family transcriptional regulator [Actinosynnema mirum]ACU38301.1 transcriptional regulator, AraC family [Actinosynnema mirum DSM 43827]AXX31823.1 Transcriptional regulator, AraC family [Actinosynnema pretiosum subsp. pretiosum]QUF04187.1 AraC family transcriptional regulator [Actinosynnema pretiosum subsp. pretiosum]